MDDFLNEINKYVNASDPCKDRTQVKKMNSLRSADYYRLS